MHLSTKYLGWDQSIYAKLGPTLDASALPSWRGRHVAAWFQHPSELQPVHCGVYPEDPRPASVLLLEVYHTAYELLFGMLQIDLSNKTIYFGCRKRSGLNDCCSSIGIAVVAWRASSDIRPSQTKEISAVSQ